jgi:hypothetical protein
MKIDFIGIGTNGVADSAGEDGRRQMVASLNPIPQLEDANGIGARVRRNRSHGVNGRKSGSH